MDWKSAERWAGKKVVLWAVHSAERKVVTKVGTKAASTAGQTAVHSAELTAASLVACWVAH